MSESREIPDRPTGPEEDAGPHGFEPDTESREADDFVVATCACGWRGPSFPTSEQGHPEAKEEWERHATASLHGTKNRPPAP